MRCVLGLLQSEQISSKYSGTGLAWDGAVRMGTTANAKWCTLEGSGWISASGKASGVKYPSFSQKEPQQLYEWGRGDLQKGLHLFSSPTV